MIRILLLGLLLHEPGDTALRKIDAIERRYDSLKELLCKEIFVDDNKWRVARIELPDEASFRSEIVKARNDAVAEGTPQEKMREHYSKLLQAVKDVHEHRDEWEDEQVKRLQLIQNLQKILGDR